MPSLLPPYISTVLKKLFMFVVFTNVVTAGTNERILAKRDAGKKGALSKAEQMCMYEGIPQFFTMHKPVFFIDEYLYHKWLFTFLVIHIDLWTS